MEWFITLPMWFRMIIISAITVTIIYLLVRYGIKLKVGSVEAEIDTDDEDVKDVK